VWRQTENKEHKRDKKGLIAVGNQEAPDALTRAELAGIMLKYLFDKESRRNWKKYRDVKARLRMLNRECKESKSCLKDLYQVCVNNVSVVTSPLVLISQIQRSGGSLLAQLFDGHPEIHAHPHELKIGKPKKYIWPKIDLNDNAENWFYLLFEDDTIEHFKEGYRKERKQEDTFPFIFLPSLQKKIFLKYLDSIHSITVRDVFDAYMTSYFGAWLNYQNSYGQKKYVTAFTARLAMYQNNMESFFEVYSDGRLISIVRDPKNWLPSALRHNEHIKRDKYTDMNLALSQWRESATATLRNKKKYGERVCIIRFEDLIGKTESVMRSLAESLDIAFDHSLLMPTFNRCPIKANTSFESEQHGIMQSALARHKTLSEEDVKTIDSLTGNEYEMVLNKAATF
jgi:hypothetical protein